MSKPLQRNRYRNKTRKTCENCINCMYVESRDMYCDLTVDAENKTVKWVYDEFCPTEDYMWCKGNKFEER